MKINPKFYLSFLVLVCLLTYLILFTFPSKSLKIVACDVGQGDAILSVYGATQILIDGGRGSLVMECLGKHIPFWDRRLELVILTHPQADHYEGLINVFREYEVDTFLANSLDSTSEGYKVLKNEVMSSQTKVINPKKGMGIRLGLITLNILHPTEEFLAENVENSLTVKQLNGLSNVLGVFTSKTDPNEFSIQTLLTFQDFNALFTGDASPELADKMGELIPDFINSSVHQSISYLKVPHHGSRNGLSENLLKAVNPEVAIISSGKNNTYGHPHKDILDMLAKFKIPVYRTDEMGDIVVETDGVDLRVRP